ncbi:hypothetical protein EJ05DRAFT_472979 [Pseudovirgaria hyperparasitica]|uniref:Zn(2)-C6 fungal-type domain-containing protein n=1 Tax=Pseudovirgaria hyperparasitica TaxID=470096 RepID=A0A6A6WIG4_9PEZI|nr:uncharacterized protein EJ05DRAFT_472979 [Pseudovirgaria hyperparasitica]KAF2762049.1 hypothetical protein EJ05DRAFT_472979 [Pseudovirgaria hyperparasitica]
MSTHRSTGTRKLKCSGTTPKCARCEREGVRCEYSPQKQMGRPKKRRRADESEQQDTPPDEVSPETPAAPAITMDDLGFGHGAGFDDFDFDMFSGMLQCDQGHQHQINIDPALSNNQNGTYPTPYLEAWNGFTACESIQQWQQHTNQQNLLYPIIPSPNPTPATTTSTTTTITPHPPAPDQSPQPPAASTTPICSCLSSMYLTLSTLSTLPTHSFPQILSPIRSSLAVASTVLTCPTCPLASATLIQNIGVLQTLLTTLANTFFRALAAIDTEATRLTSAGDTRAYRFSEHSSPDTPAPAPAPGIHTAHAPNTVQSQVKENNSTNEEDSPTPSFSLEFTGDEWRALARKALQAEAGTCKGRPPERTFVGVVESMVVRQRRWHADLNVGQMCEHLYFRKRKKKDGGEGVGQDKEDEGQERGGGNGEGKVGEDGCRKGMPGTRGRIEEHDCVRQLQRIRKMVELMGFDE